MKELVTFFIYSIVSYVLVWIQLYGQTKWLWLHNNIWWFMYCLSIPISYLLTNGTLKAYNYFQSSAWAVTFISFSINIIIFALMNYFINNETINLKNAICLLLCIIVISIQSFWK